MPAIHPVSLRDIPQDFAKLYFQHELLSSRARQQGMSCIIENYIHDVRIEKKLRESRQKSANVILASNKAATNKVNQTKCLFTS